MIISANSDEDVLKDQEIDGGLRNYWLYVPNTNMLHLFASAHFVTSFQVIAVRWRMLGATLGI
jgi:hypothetical protein